MGFPGANRRSGYIPPIPALDGIRAIAVIAVLLYHADLLWAPGGFLGVEVFFVLSGFLITALLWSELVASGGLGFRGFWFRRARRLLPALFGLLLVTLAAFLIGWPHEIAAIRGDVAAAFTYSSNWYLIGVNRSYFQTVGRPSPFGHLWSLAIEEQFYLLWPLALVLLYKVVRR
ncbi:MAG: acyltransferase, partial [Actinobacteria bacterium]